MILKGALLIVLTCFTSGHRFIAPRHRVFIILLLTLLLNVSCARPGALAGNRASPLVYVAIGDSTGIGVGARNGGGYVDRLFARIEQKRSGSTLINLCAAGATTADAVNKQIPRLADTRANLVTVCVGVNDLVRGGEEKQFAQSYETLVVKLKQSARLVVVANLPDLTSAPAMKEAGGDSLRSQLERFNKVIEEVARRHGVTMVDLYHLSGETIRSHPEFFSSDGLHPSDLGYSHWAEAMWAVVEQVIHEPGRENKSFYPQRKETALEIEQHTARRNIVAVAAPSALRKRPAQPKDLPVVLQFPLPVRDARPVAFLQRVTCKNPTVALVVPVARIRAPSF